MHDRSPKRRVTGKQPATEQSLGRPAPRARSSAVDDVASASRDRANGRFAKPTGGSPRAGVALPATLRSTMEARFDHPFADVRVHDDALAHRAAQSAGALALTQGRDIRFASGAYQPRTWAGLELLAHELAHVVQQSGGNAAARRTVGTASASHEREADVAAHRVARGLRAGRLSPARTGARQRKPGDPFKLDVGEGVTVEGVEGKLATVIKYKGRSWITLDVKRGNLNVSVKRKKGVGTALRITVESHSWVEAQLDIATENRILADNRNKAGFLVHYEFKIHGTVTRGVNGVPGPDVRRGPSQRMVGQYHTPGEYDVERHVRGAPGFVQFEKWGPLDVKDSVKTFKSKSKLNRYLKKHPNQNFAIVKMPDGRWGVRPLSEKGLAKIADIARSGKYGESDWLSRFDWYKNDWAKGELRGFSLRGQRIKALAGLENLYFSDDLFASIGGEGAVREAEVFKMGPNDSTFGRKPLSHEQALARWAEIDAMSVDKFDKTETAPGRPLHQLVVRGASGAHHKVGRDYLLGKVAFHTKVKSIDAQPDDDAKRKASDSLAFPMVRDYVTVIADRPKDDPAFVKALQTHRPLAQHLATYFYTKAEDEGQQWVVSTFIREAAAVRDQLADQENLPRLIFSFPQLPPAKKQHVLELAGFEKDVLETWKKTLSDPAKAASISVGNKVDGLDISQFRTQAEKTAKGMDDLVDQVKNDKIIAIRDKGPFGDMVRQVVYRKLGYSLDPKKFPHSNKVPSLGLLGFDPLSGSRSSFTSIREQMFASKMRSLASVDEFEKWATRATIALASLLIVVALNAAGLGIAAAFATEGTLKFFVIQSIVVGAGMTGVEFVQHKMAGTEMSPGQVLEAGAWNIATAGLLGRLGWGLRNASTARRTFWMASAFMGAGTARFMADRRGKFTRAELASFMIENGVMFLVMEGVGVMTRSLNESALAIGRAKRLGVHADEIAALRGKVDAFKSELAAYASKPGEISRQAKALQAKEKALLQENQALLEKLRAKAKTKGDAAALEKDLSAQLKGIRDHLDAMKKAEYLAELRIKPVGASQTEYSYEGAAAAASSSLEKLYAGSKATVDPDGTIRLKTPDAPDPLLFVPASSVKAASPQALPKAGTQKVDINAAEPSELTQLNGVGKELAKAIKEHRDANGKFESVGDLAKVPGIGKGTLAKIRAQNMATVKPQKPGKPVAEWRADLMKRRDAVIERALALGLEKDPTLAQLPSRQSLGGRTLESSLKAAEKSIAAAETKIGKRAASLGKKALAKVTKQLSKAELEQVRGGQLEDVPDSVFGEAIARVPSRIRARLGVEELRAVLHAHKNGVDIGRFFAAARAHKASVRNEALRMYGSLADANVRAEVVLTDMAVQPSKWHGGFWALEFATQRLKPSDIRTFELPADGGGRRYDIALKNGVKYELKFWVEWRADVVDKFIKQQFLFDFGYGEPMANAFKWHRYVFRAPAPESVSNIRALMRQALKKEMVSKSLSAAHQKRVLADFDATTDLVTEVASFSSPVKPTVTAPPTPAHPKPADREEKKPTP